jgi:hypothetical protein
MAVFAAFAVALPTFAGPVMAPQDGHFNIAASDQLMSCSIHRPLVTEQATYLIKKSAIKQDLQLRQVFEKLSYLFPLCVNAASIPQKPKMMAKIRT